MKRSEYSQIIKLAKRALEDYQNWGEDEIYKESAIETPAEKPRPKPAKESSFSLKQCGPAQELEALKKEAVKCRKCPLGATRLNCVFGAGAADADLMFVGEGPGFEEDHKGEPFIGKAGQFLTNLIELMGYSRESVYIANIVKCHPMKDPSNPHLRGNDKPPTKEEVAECSKYLEAQISIIKPKVIVTLGRPSAGYFFGESVVMGAVRGKFRQYKGIKLMPTYHPSYLIRNGCIFGKKDQSPQITKMKKEVWSDLKKVMHYLKTGEI